MKMEKFSLTNWLDGLAFRGIRRDFLEGFAHALLTPNSSPVALLRTLAARTPNRSVSDVYKAISRRLGAGQSIGTAIAPFFPAQERSLILAADQSARTDADRGRGFLVVAKMIGGLTTIQRSMYELVAQAIASLLVIAFVWLGLGLHVGGEFGRALPRERWPELSRYVIGSGEALLEVWPFAVFLVGVLVTGVLWIFPNWTGPARRFADRHLPGFVLYRTLRSSPQLLTLGGYLAAGLGFKGALSLLMASSNPWQRMYLEAMALRLKSKLSVDIVDVGYFTWETMVQIDMRSQQGEIAAAMQDVAVTAFPIIERSLTTRAVQAKAFVRALQTAVVGVVVLAVALLYATTVTSFGANF